MPGFLIPLAGLALGALGRLVSKRRQARAGAAFGSAINTQPQGPPTNAVSQAATTSPMPPTVKSAGQPTGLERQGYQENAGDEASKAPPSIVRPATGPVQQNVSRDAAQTANPELAAPPEAGLGARLGAASKARDRRKNLQQQATLAGAATTLR
jgi:hypothetical protein